MSGAGVLQEQDAASRDRLAWIVRCLTVVAGMVIFVGGLLLILRHGFEATRFQTFSGEPTALRSAPEIAAAAAHGEELAIIQFGILMLIATPVARVFFAGIGFVRERDWLYVAVAAIVLSVLMASFAGHKV